MTEIPPQAFEFDLLFELPAGAADQQALLDALFEAGCNDALVGLGRPGFINLSFTRCGESLEPLIAEATGAVLSALPEGSRLRQDVPGMNAPPASSLASD